MATLETAFGIRSVQQAVGQHPDATVREDLPTVKLFKKGMIGKVNGEQAEFDRRVKRRRLAPVGGRDDAPHETVAPDEKVITVGLFHTVQLRAFRPAEIFVERRGFGSGADAVNDNAAERCMEAVEDLVSNARRTQELIAAQQLQSAGAAITINSTLIPHTALSLAVQNADIQTQAMGAKWDVQTTKILSGANQLRSAKKLLRDKGYEPGMLIYTDVPAAGLYGNSEIKDWAARSGGLNLEFLKEKMPGYSQASLRRGQDPFTGTGLNGVGGIEKWCEWNHGYALETSGDAFTRYYSDTKGVLLPTEDDLKNVLGWAAAPALVPTGPNVIGSGEQAAGLISKKDDISVYAYIELEHPHRIVIICQSHWVSYIRDGFGIATLTSLT